MDGTLTQKNGFSLDFSKMLGCGRLRDTDFVELSGKMVSAHAAICKLRETGRIKNGDLVLFPTLPYVESGNLNTPESIADILAYADSLRGNTQAVVSIGIGGSYLGARVLVESLLDSYWNNMSDAERNGRPRIYFSGNNLDAGALDSLVRQLIRQAKAQNGGYRVNLIVVSKSGTTLENAASFMTLYTRLQEHKDLIDVQMTAITQPSPTGSNPLEQLAREQGWKTFRVPEGVGGRFCVFSDAGLLIGAIAGLDIKEFLRGAKDMQEECVSGNPLENTALMSACLKYIAREKYGKYIEVFMPYCEKLKALSEWYVQLLAESLGKKFDFSGAVTHYSRTPLVAVGSTDMHAQTQEHQEGMNNKVLQFIRIEEPDVDVVVPEAFVQAEFFNQFAGLSFNQINDMALKANADALDSECRFSMVANLPRLNEYYLGALMYFCMLSIAYEAELAGINAFDQPGVEVYKRFLREQMRKK